MPEYERDVYDSPWVWLVQAICWAFAFGLWVMDDLILASGCAAGAVYSLNAWFKARKDRGVDLHR